MNQETVKEYVRDRYGSIASRGGGGCCGSASRQSEKLSESVGYSHEEMNAVPEGANLGLGCGNPLASESIKTGETVLDLGSGAGFDAFLAARQVGPEGKVIGVDMTPQMIARARANAEKAGVKNVEFRLGEIENLPVADGAVDLIISNCVINLVPDKATVFRDAFRVLKSGGRMMVSDIVVKSPLPDEVSSFLPAIGACVGGASLLADYTAAIAAAGFKDVRILQESGIPAEWLDDPDLRALATKQGYSSERVAALAADVVSIKVSAVKR
ncbi:arsenite methyltransferase [Leptonema illini]|uniref:Arsenite methyltransferase n=1 Tax=Leptonema illini DSM 21528 TaxID=929563 RepID=H2CAB2_9LEPT|nr:arsenite methyltransferase [Leptonema illini]EHQ06270.1 Methyltransferase type 11 [Leptonema illini DSM 21528]